MNRIKIDVLNSDDRLLGTVYLPEVPQKGDCIFVGRKDYWVDQRIWDTVGADLVGVRLRVC